MLFYIFFLVLVLKLCFSSFLLPFFVPSPFFLHLFTCRGSGILASERGSGHIHSSERDSGIGGITIGPVTRSRGSNGDMIIGNQPALDVDALLRHQQVRRRSMTRSRQRSLNCQARQSGEGREGKSPTGSTGSGHSQQLTPTRWVLHDWCFVILIIETLHVFTEHQIHCKENKTIKVFSFYIYFSRQLTDAEKLRKVVVELVDTERTYVKHLSYLLQVIS